MVKPVRGGGFSKTYGITVFADSSNDFLNETQIQDSSSVLLMADSVRDISALQVSWIQNWAPQPWSNCGRYIHARHDGQANILYTDGHVIGVDAGYRVIDDELNEKHYNRKWSASVLPTSW